MLAWRTTPSACCLPSAKLGMHRTAPLSVQLLEWGEAQESLTEAAHHALAARYRIRSEFHMQAMNRFCCFCSNLLCCDVFGCAGTVCLLSRPCLMTRRACRCCSASPPQWTCSRCCTRSVVHFFVAVSLWFFVCQTHDTSEVRALRSALSAGCHDHVRPSGKVCIRLCSRTDL